MDITDIIDIPEYFIYDVYNMFYEYLVEFLGSILLVYVIFATKNPLAIGFSYAFILLLTQIGCHGKTGMFMLFHASNWGGYPNQKFNGLFAGPCGKSFHLD